MGQRFQIVIQTPKEYWNKDNPNNSKGNIYIYHCQWMWGYFSIWRMGQLIKGIKKLIRTHDKNTNIKQFPIDYKRLLESAINWVCYKNLLSQNNIYPYFDAEGYKFKEGEDFKSLFKGFDNNNGVLFIKITNDKKILYFFYNPDDNEGSIHNKPLRWDDYLKDYEREINYKNAFEKDREYKESVKHFEKSIFLEKIPKIEKWMLKEPNWAKSEGVRI